MRESLVLQLQGLRVQRFVRLYEHVRRYAAPVECTLARSKAIETSSLTPGALHAWSYALPEATRLPAYSARQKFSLISALPLVFV